MGVVPGRAKDEYRGLSTSVEMTAVEGMLRVEMTEVGASPPVEMTAVEGVLRVEMTEVGASPPVEMTAVEGVLRVEMTEGWGGTKSILLWTRR